VILSKAVSLWLIRFAALIAFSCAFSHTFINANPNPRVSVAFAVAFTRRFAFFTATIVSTCH
jgi:prophage maintenance system killer protein